jgi:hypothetical protein
VTVQDLFQAALALPEGDRVKLIEQLEASLHADFAEDDAFVATVNERVAAAEAGEPGKPADEVFARLLAR